MSKVSRIESDFSCTAPVKRICHIYAVGGNSISLGTLQYNSDSTYPGLTAEQKAKYWDTVHENIWRLNDNYMSTTSLRTYHMEKLQKQFEPLFAAPETATDCYSSPMIIFKRLQELHNDNRVIAFCHVGWNGTGFQDLTVQNWNVNEDDPVYNSKCLTKILARRLDLLIKHMTALGYECRVEGLFLIGQSVIDVWGFNAATYSKAQFKIDFTDVVNYFRTTLGYGNIPVYVTETSQMGLYPVDGVTWNDAIAELNVSLGDINICNISKWVICPDNTHPSGRTGVLAWGEGATTDGKKNMAQIVYENELNKHTK